MRYLGVVVLLTVLLAGMLQSQAQAAEATPDYAPGQVIVQYRDGTTDVQAEQARGRVNGSTKEALRRQGSGEVSLEVVSLPEQASVIAAVATLKNDPQVAFAEPNWVLRAGPTTTSTVSTTSATDCSGILPSSNDEIFMHDWMWGVFNGVDINGGCHVNQYGSQAGRAWGNDIRGNDAVYIGVIDEGIDLRHRDLAANIWSNLYDPVDGIDNDGNGYVDDVNGWDFYYKDNSIYDGPDDDHGTHVAGTIGAVGGNGYDIAGVSWNVTLISGKFLGPNGGYTSDAVKAVSYFTDLKMRHGLNIVALNNSWGGGGYSQALHDTIIRAAKADILFIAAAGNNGTNNDRRAHYPSNYDTTKGTTTESPASYDSVIGVAAIDEYGSLASFSNYGSKTVELGAPGVGILSTTPNNGVQNWQGTSMATPHVTGAVALYASTKLDGSTGRVTVSAAQIRNSILGSAAVTKSLKGKTVTGGRLDANAALSR